MTFLIPSINQCIIILNLFFPVISASINQCCGSYEIFNSKIPNDLKTLDSDQEICVKSEDFENIPNSDFDSFEPSFSLSNCTKRYILSNKDHPQFRILEDGRVQFVLVYHFYKSIWLTVPNSKYCIANTEIQSNGSTIEIKNSTMGSQDILIFCEFDSHMKFQTATKMYGISRFIAGINLIIVLVVYLVNWKSHKVIGWLTCCYILSLTCHCVWMGSLFLAPLDWFQPRGELIVCQTSVQISRYVSFVLLFTALEFYIFMFLNFWKMHKKVRLPGKDLRIVPKFFVASWVIPALIFVLDLQVGKYFGPSYPWIYRSYSGTNHMSIVPYTIILFYSIMICNVGAILAIIASAATILYLRTSSVLTKKSYTEALQLFVRLILGSGFFLLCYAVADVVSRETNYANTMKWQYWNIIYCILAVVNSFYFLIVFGLTGNNFTLFATTVRNSWRLSRPLSSSTNQSGGSGNSNKPIFAIAYPEKV